MGRDDLRERIADQFSYRGERADVWRGFDLVLDTDAFLNLGYSPWYLPHVVGSSQSRLARVVGRRLAAALPETAGVRLLDVGCGRGGPAVHLADRFGFDVVGVDLVSYNVRRAADTAAGRPDAAFVVGDATRLPVRSDALPACTAVDALVYVPEKAAVFAELARVLEPDGVAVCSDLVARSDLDDADRAAVDAFADAWDMPPLPTVDAYRAAVDGAGLTVRSVEDLTANSVGRFRRWTTLYLGLAGAFDGRPLAALLRRFGLDPSAVTEQVRRAHEALPDLRHVVVVAER
ncbi:class I SAM-dependent methyltransferase [Haloplanus halophilus]|uniref:class I SAM-dependent methyltransferase n=1 Tax=Haloplanus halophilus TaxID=2949993 RepID=UPI00203BD9DF|nr:class I SAM-dependent methyltransferase [Haloplanus sp. GDY1]